MKHDKLLSKAARFGERILPPVNQVLSKGTGKTLRFIADKSGDASLKRAVSLADLARQKIADSATISDPRSRLMETEKIQSEYLKSIEKMKADRVSIILKKIEDAEIRETDGLKYAKSGVTELESLTLEKAKLRALTMSGSQIDAAIGNVNRTGIYSEIEFLALAGNASEKQRRRIGEVMAENPVYLADGKMQDLLVELESLTSTSSGHLPYRGGDDGFISADVMEFLNDPEQKKIDPKAKNFQALRDGLQKAEVAKDKALIKDLLTRIEQLEKEKEPGKVK